MYLIADLIYILEYYFFIKRADQDSLKSIKSLRKIGKANERSFECHNERNVSLHYDLPDWYKVALKLNHQEKHSNCLPCLNSSNNEIIELYCQKFHIQRTSTVLLEDFTYIDCRFLDKFYLNFDEKIIYLNLKIIGSTLGYSRKYPRVIKRKNDFTFEIIFLQNQNLRKIDELKIFVETNLYKDLNVNIAFTSHNIYYYSKNGIYIYD